MGNIIILDMVFVQGGTFQMGGSNENSKPAHEVQVQDFYMAKYPVTQTQWKAVMGYNPSYFNHCETCPVERVSWIDVQEFIQKLNKMTGKTYRLPSEAEWEWAARGGRMSKGYIYAGSNDLDEVAWYEDNSAKTHPVGQKKPNELGLYDMNGNVCEWCEDDWHDNYKGAPVDGSAWVNTPRDCSRVFQGGSWCSPFTDFISYVRYGVYATSRYSSFGFRLAFDFNTI